jgi:lipoprotein-anchoring transpeptidase ErfK/SrfK
MGIAEDSSSTTQGKSDPWWARPWVVFGFALAVVLATALLVAAWAYDRGRGDTVPAGVRAGPVALGGLSGAQARARLRGAAAWGDTHAVTLVVGSRRLDVVPGKVGVALDANSMADSALAVSTGANFLSRDLHTLTGAESNARISPVLTSGSDAALVRLGARLSSRARDATLAPTPSALVVNSPQDGISPNPGALRASLAHALLYHVDRVVVPGRRVAPGLTVAALRRRYPAYITIDRGAFTLRVYQHLHLVRSYPIAVGMQGLDTPAGLYHIQDKQVDPSWSVPHSAWAGSLAGQVIPPGPSDPLKARWMGIFNGAGIHGTDETDSIGHAFSHGCVRMLIPDVIDLYDRVKVGTPVYIGD